MSIVHWAKLRGLATARVLGVHRALHRAGRHRLLVLCYHSVVEDARRWDGYRARLAVGLAEFRQQLEFILRHFHPIAADDLLGFLAGRQPLPPHPVLITFDDGLRNNLTHAAPLLERLGVPALVFVTSGLIGGRELLWTHELDERILQWPGDRCPLPAQLPAVRLPAGPARWRVAAQVGAVCKRMPDEARRAYLAALRAQSTVCISDSLRELYELLSWDEVRGLQARGFAIGAHTVDHPILTRLAPAALAQQLAQSKQTIEAQLQTACPWVAYPNGGPADCSVEVFRAAAAAGYRAGFVLSPRRNVARPDALGVRRLCVMGGMPRESFRARVCGLRGFGSGG
jgi:peptidoglycan/xylan/chitin deacetylase (PgdA/CDA1 family)